MYIVQFKCNLMHTGTAYVFFYACHPQPTYICSVCIGIYAHQRGNIMGNDIDSSHHPYDLCTYIRMYVVQLFIFKFGELCNKKQY